MQVSIIIVNYNTPDLVEQCLQSIAQRVHGCSYDVIVVDNASEDDSAKRLSACKDIRLIVADSNLGFGKANNLGATKASGDILFFLNPDTILCNDAVTILLDYLAKNQQAGIVGGNLFDADKKPTHSFSRLFPSITQEMDFAAAQLYTRMKYGNNRQFNHTGKPLEVAFITGADLMIRRELFEEAEGFDKDFFMYYEDTALCYKVSQLGHKIISVPEAEIIHLEGKSFNVSQAREDRIQDGRYLFFHKFHSPIYNNVADLLNKASMQVAKILCKLTGKTARYERYACRYKAYKTAIKKYKL